MNKTFFKDIYRMIAKTKDKFVLLSLIVAIGVAFFVGVKSSSPIMANSINYYNKNFKLMDITIFSPYGFDDNDINSIKGISGISGVYGKNFIDAFVGNKVIRVHDISSDVNNVKVVAGRLPNNINECVVEEGQIIFDGFKINDVINLYRNDDSLNDFLKTNEFKVVGIINTPYYLNDDKGYSTLNNRVLDSYIYVNKDAFINDFYTELSVVFDTTLYETSFSKKYSILQDKIKSQIEYISKSQIENRKDIVLSKANDEYNEGLKEYNYNLKKYNDEIFDAENKIEEAKKDIIDGEKEISDGYAEILKNKKILSEKIIEGQNKINEERINLSVKESTYKTEKNNFELKKVEYNTKLNDIKLGLNEIETNISNVNNGINQIKTTLEGLYNNLKMIESQLSLIDSSNPNYNNLINQKSFIENNINNLNIQVNNLNTNLNVLNSKKNELIGYQTEITQGLIDGENKLNHAYELIQRGYEELTNASVELEKQEINSNKELDDAKNKLDKAKIELEESKVKLEDSIIEFNKNKIDGKEKLESAKADLDKALQDINDLKDGEWIILDRSKHYSSKTFSDTLKQMNAIGNVFPAFFILVASLVCLTTMSRIIDEERSQIGIFIALGYSKKIMYIKYVIYAFLSTLIGCVIGNIIGLSLFPQVIYKAWGMMYIMPEYIMYIPWDLIILSNVLFITIMVFSAYYSCKSEIQEVPATLLRAKTNIDGKKIFLENIKLFWNKLNFTDKITLRNIIRNKKRSFMTIVGVSGCIALLLVGFGIKDSISTILNSQFNEINLYDGIVNFDEKINHTDKLNILSNVKNLDNVEEAYVISIYSSKIYKDSLDNVVNVTVLDDDENMFNLKNGKNTVYLDDEGVLITKKLSELMNLSEGDTIQIESFNGVLKDVKIKNIIDMNVNHYLIISNNYYKTIFNTNSVDNSIILKSKVSDTKILQNELLEIENVRSITFFDSIIDNFNSMISGLNAVVYVIILSSGTLAFIVLSNLTNINISERQREMATLKVLGFRKKEINSYLYKENIILTFFGSLLGIPIGAMLHKYIIMLVEMDEIMFGRNISFLSVIISIFLTMIFVIIVNIFMSKKVINIKMVESLKSIE
ncbi:MAG: FtsX-like permease family protein [Erysipelotrichaceae bacterium]|nr:FtsX-like permease family protein [Erysipelotrichaceae bacterium]